MLSFLCKASILTNISMAVLPQHLTMMASRLSRELSARPSFFSNIRVPHCSRCLYRRSSRCHQEQGLWSLSFWFKVSLYAVAALQVRRIRLFLLIGAQYNPLSPVNLPNHLMAVVSRYTLTLVCSQLSSFSFNARFLIQLCPLFKRQTPITQPTKTCSFIPVLVSLIYNMSLSIRDVSLPADEVPAWVQTGQISIYLNVVLSTLVVYDSRTCQHIFRFIRTSNLTPY